MLFFFLYIYKHFLLTCMCGHFSGLGWHYQGGSVQLQLLQLPQPKVQRPRTTCAEERILFRSRIARHFTALVHIHATNDTNSINSFTVCGG